jgi:hypothetical protein
VLQRRKPRSQLFYYLGIGPGIATTVIDVNVSTDDRFYALDIGLGFAT